MGLSVVSQGLIVVSLLLLLSVGSSWATTRIVPTQFPTIQAAMVASANSGDTVLVNPGTYHEKVDFLGKEVVLRSLAGADATVIDAAGLSAPGVLLVGVGQRGRVIGFTIKNGTGTFWQGAFTGGGVHVREGTGDGPLIADNVITDNFAGEGGGITALGPARVVHNRIVHNTAAANGGGLYGGYRLIVADNEIFDNVVINQTGWGGGVALPGGDGEFSGNVVACNTGGRGGGLAAYTWSSLGLFIEGNTFILNQGHNGPGGCYLIMYPEPRTMTFRANVVAFNFQGGGIDCNRAGLGDDLIATCNDLWGNSPDLLDDECGPFLDVNNNFREDPVFGVFTGCPPGNDDFCLDEQSQLLAENSPPGCGLIGARGLCSIIGIADETPAPEAERNRISAQPNPFTTRTTLVIDLVTPSQIDLRISNALGRVVAEQSLGALHAGRHRWTWDGRDAGGRQAPAGVYYAEVQAGGRSIVTRLMILR